MPKSALNMLPYRGWQAAVFATLAAAFVMAGGTNLFGQEGHPLTGSWHGTWAKAGKAKAKAEPQNIVVFMKWDNKNVTGILNPGRNQVPLKGVTLNAADWTVHLEADLKDGQHISADGKLENIGSYNRTITGTWTQGPEKGEFKITRD